MRKTLAYLAAFVIAGYVVYLDYLLVQGVVGRVVELAFPSAPEYQVHAFVRYLFYLTGAFVIFVYSAYFIFYLYFKGNERGEPSPRFYPKVSIVVPARNEAMNIGKLIESIRYQDYPRDCYEIIVVDDGSEDGTGDIAQRFGAKVVRHEKNLGKAKALESGISVAEGDVVITMDADSYLGTGSSLRNIVANLFGKPFAGISTGIIRIDERGLGLIEKFQSIEYLNSFEIGRRVQGYMDWLLVVPGAFSAFKGYFLKSLPAVPKETLAEDFELAMVAYRGGLTSNFEPKAVTYTEPVDSWSALYRQRIRWYYGGLQVLAKYNDMIMNRKYGERGLFLFLHMIILEYVLPTLHVFGLVAFPTILILQNLLGVQILDVTLPNHLIIFVFLLVLLLQYLPGIVIDFSAIAIEWEAKRALKYLPFIVLYYVLYNPLLSIAKVDSLARFLRGVVQSW